MEGSLTWVALCRQGTEVSLKELDSLIKMLAEKKQHVQQEEAEVNMEILMDFLEKSRRQKQEQLDEVRHGEGAVNACDQGQSACLES